MGKRLEWIDALKGIGIVFVVLGHAKPAGLASTYIYSFHMPLFFFISGYMFSIGRHPTLINFVKTRARQLLVPYLYFSAIAILILYARFNIGDIHTFSLTDNVKIFFLSQRSSLSYDIPLWFLTSLFTVEILYYLMRKYLHNPFLLFCLVMLSGYIGVAKLQCFSVHTNLPWSFDFSMFYLVFYGLGNLLKEAHFEFRSNKLLTAVLLCVHFVLVLKLSFIKLSPGPILYIRELSVAAVGILAYFYLATSLPPIRLFKFLGQNTVTILSLHIPLAFRITYMVQTHFHIVLVRGYKIMAIYTVCTFLILLPIIFAINKYLPFMLGKVTKVNVGKATM